MRSACSLIRTEQDDIDVRAFGGQKKKRTAFAQSDTGKQLVTAMIDADAPLGSQKKRCAAGSSMSLKLCCWMGNGPAADAWCADTYTGEQMPIQADAVIMACGGMHGLFGDTTGSLANTGEAVAELFRLGVPLGQRRDDTVSSDDGETRRQTAAHQ